MDTKSKKKNKQTHLSKAFWNVVKTNSDFNSSYTWVSYQKLIDMRKSNSIFHFNDSRQEAVIEESGEWTRRQHGQCECNSSKHPRKF